MAYFIYVISGLLHEFSLLFAGVFAMEVSKDNKHRGRIALWVTFIFCISGLMTSIVAGYLMFSEALQ